MVSWQDLTIVFVSGLATALGGILAALGGRAAVKAMPLLLGLAAGIGFTVVFFDLLPGAIRAGTWAAAIVGMTVGIACARFAGSFFSHTKVCGIGTACSLIPGQTRENLSRMGYLFALGVAMHNLPEGLAVGAGLEAGRELGLLLAAAIGLHNIPEGMALTGVFIMGGARPSVAVAVSAGAGLLLPMGALLAGIWMAVTPGMFSFILALGAGVLFYIIITELIPGSLRMHPSMAKTGMIAGSLLSLALSVIFSQSYC